MLTIMDTTESLTSTHRRIAESNPQLAARGQLGNVNAIKHGLYSHLFRATELGRLDDVKPVSLREEIDMFRLTIRRLVDRSAEFDEPEMHLRYVVVLSHALAQLTRMVRAQAFLPASDDVAEIISQAIAETAAELGIHL